MDVSRFLKLYKWYQIAQRIILNFSITPSIFNSPLHSKLYSKLYKLCHFSWFSGFTWAFSDTGKQKKSQSSCRILSVSYNRPISVSYNELTKALNCCAEYRIPFVKRRVSKKHQLLVMVGA